ncbi:MAG TPA: RNA polymerase sigma factor [Nannocystis sp.]
MRRPPDPRTDEELNAALLAGDKSAGAVLYDRHFAPLRGYFINKVADPSVWDDLVHQTFEVLLGKPVNFKGDSTYRSYVFGVAHNILRTHYRAQRLQSSRRDDSIEQIEELSVSDLGPGVSTLVTNQADAQRLIEALRKIPIKYQSVFEMYYWQDLPASEIARTCACPIGTVRGRLRLAKKALLEKLALEGGSYGELLRGFRSVDAWSREVRAELGTDDDDDDEGVA